MTEEIVFFVPGHPRPKGSTRSFVNRQGKLGVLGSSEVCKNWGGRIAAFAAGHWIEPPSTAPILLRLEFLFSRPKKHYRAGRREGGGLRGNNPSYPVDRADLDKLERAVLDGLTGVVYVDDRQVVGLRSSKEWATEAEGVRIAVRLA